MSLAMESWRVLRNALKLISSSHIEIQIVILPKIDGAEFFGKKCELKIYSGRLIKNEQAITSRTKTDRQNTIVTPINTMKIHSIIYWLHIINIHVELSMTRNPLTHIFQNLSQMLCSEFLIFFQNFFAIVIILSGRIEDGSPFFNFPLLS